ncbi:ligand-binding sensor domain-containing protein [Formosa algae]|uniref:Two-component sensor histidine kinase/ligand-binding sensor domain-containing protein n=1 Tax=Formosa algae TaxID=225843 RepID=A0A9X0YKL2_9FLAO|nr:two-component regulator propeller domain-containing protein [Formosa algae]MBP1838934.1 two-component sensor histidine kinase/ligand-binding sensor domain-containing protein [Formosa algae]MDQ0333711.1 two-component sensor histidine kinase/ligand-binding sensor domain-containing protein [Formosa algae]
MRSVYLVCVVFLWSIYANGQTSDIIQINYLGQEHGLLQLNTKALALDDMGYLWVGTEDGLHRFNGHEFKSYISNPKDQSSLSDDHIRGLLSVKDTLWIATNSKGIQGYIRSKNQFFSLLTEQDHPDLNNTYKAFQLTEKLLLFSAKNHFILFDRRLKTHTIINLSNLSIENRVEDVLVLDRKRAWLATKETGILELNLEDYTTSHVPDFERKDVSSFVDTKDEIYIGSAQGIQVYNKATSRFSDTKIKTTVDGFHKISDSQFYVLTPKGMFKYNAVTDSYNSVIFDNVNENKHYELVDFTEVIEDNYGNMWFGTEGEGVFHYNKFQKKFDSFKVNLKDLYGDERISVFPIQKENDSTLWLGTYAGTVSYNLKTGASKLYNTGKGGITYDFCKDKNGTLWAGGITDGLMKYDAITDRFKQWKHTASENSLTDNEVLNIIPVSKEKLWVCTWSGGINEFDIATETFTKLAFNGTQIDRARTSIIDSKNHIWLGTDNGLYEIESKKIIRHITETAKGDLQLTNNRIFSISEDHKGNLWVGTASGLTYINTKTQTSTLYYKQKGFPNDFVYGIVTDANHKVWMSTNFGLSVFNPIDKSFTNYTKEDGLQDNEFNGKSFFKDDQGILYFGGIDGFNIINTNQIIDNPYLPNVSLESVELFNQPIENNEMFKDTLIFKSKENVLTFNFSAIHYLNPNKCLYQYKLEDFDDNWSPVSKKNNVTYTNLNPGHYTLKIKASNDVGKWNPKLKTVHLIIVPPWYLKPEFKVLFIGVFLLSGILFYLFKTSKLKRDKLKLEGVIATRTRDLMVKNAELNASHSVMVEQNNNIEFLMKELNHRVKNNLQIISSLLNMQANNIEEEEVKDILNIAKNRILTIAYIQNDLASKDEPTDIPVFLKDFSRKILGLLSDSQTQKFKLIFILEPHCLCQLNTTLLGLILNELITNTYKYAFKTYSPDHLLRISCSKTDCKLKIVIEDNGIGYDSNEIRENSLGLDLVKTMVHQLNGTITVTSNNGVKNVILIPC